MVPVPVHDVVAVVADLREQLRSGPIQDLKPNKTQKKLKFIIPRTSTGMCGYSTCGKVRYMSKKQTKF